MVSSPLTKLFPWLDLQSLDMEEKDYGAAEAKMAPKMRIAAL